jgi:hypothetical protein
MFPMNKKYNSIEYLNEINFYLKISPGKNTVQFFFLFVILKFSTILWSNWTLRMLYIKNEFHYLWWSRDVSMKLNVRLFLDFCWKEVTEMSTYTENIYFRIKTLDSKHLPHIFTRNLKTSKHSDAKLPVASSFIKSFQNFHCLFMRLKCINRKHNFNFF